MFWFVLLLILLGGGFYFYQRMTALEQEIRAEQLREKEQHQAAQGSDEKAVIAPLEEQAAPSPRRSDASVAPAVAEEENSVLRLICVQPGVVQAGIYVDLPQLNKKQVQQIIRELVAAGKIRRERLGSSFKLYPV